jgi:hypothetical protein
MWKSLWRPCGSATSEHAGNGKTRILNEFVAVTGHHREAAIRRLRGRRRRKDNKRQGPVYTPDVVAALREVWEICGRKRLAPFLVEAVTVLEREREVCFPAEIRDRLVTMVPATIDRLLRNRRND